MTKLAYAPEEAAEALSIGLTQLKELIRLGKLDSFTTQDAGSRSSRRISHAALERFITEREALERGEVVSLPQHDRAKAGAA